MPQQIQLRRGTAAAWTSANPVLASGEAGVETDTNKLKFGDGATAWASLDYVAGGGGTWGSITGTLGDQTDLQAILDEKLDVTTAASTYQATLVSGTNIKTVNSTSLLGSGNIVITGGGVTVQEEGSSLTTTADTLNFVGAGVTATGSGTTKTITIDAGGTIVSDITGLTGATVVNNLVAITSAGYAAIGAPDANTIYHLTDALMGDYGAFVAGQFLVDTSATDATGLAAGDLRYNNATQGSATSLFIAGVSAGGVNLEALFALLKVGNEILAQDVADTANFQILVISGTPSVSGGNWTVPVTVASSGGTGTTGFANNLNVILAVGPGQGIVGYITPAALTSSASISWNVATVRQATLTLAHNATITLSNLADGQSVSLSGIMGGSGTHTVALAHSGLTARQMGAALSTIATLAVSDLFEISIKRSGTDLRYWVSTLEI